MKHTGWVMGNVYINQCGASNWRVTIPETW